MAKRKKRNRGGGVPFNPAVDTGTKRPVTARVAVGDVNDKFSDYPSNGLTPRRLARIFREADEGNVRAQMELFEEMEEKDTHLFSQMQIRLRIRQRQPKGKAMPKRSNRNIWSGARKKWKKSSAQKGAEAR